jgi:2-phospho-L-lactate/phosphoenolpyruvate guanylyltransferase
MKRDAWCVVRDSAFSLQPSALTFAIIPVKPLHRAKSRLARALKAPTRAALVRSIFSRTLDIIAQVERIDGVIVVSRDLTILELARQRNALALAESESGLNSAITQAAQWAARHHARAVIVIPVDLPLITAADLDAVIDRAQEERCMVIAPDRHEAGTNVLLAQPPEAIQFAYGASSFNVHRAQALERGLTVHEYRSPTTAFDIDVPDDLAWYRALDAQVLSE